ncbi:MAG: pilus assembly protein PilM [Candidatus Omnitrophica bacterium]|nr:pilus assembly protein PilM [Candidatus Omnitrophota bacterium]
MKMTFLQNKFIRKEADKFVTINLGNCYTKGLIVEGEEVTDYFIEAKKDLAATIKKWWAEKKISTKKVKVSVKDPSCLVRYFPFPKMDKKKLKQALFYEMNKFIPFPSDEVYFDFFILGEISATQSSVLLAVAKKSFIDNILDVFGKSGLRVTEINLDSICLTNLFLNNYGENKETNSCILDIGYNFSTMIILNKGVPFLTRDVKFSAKEVFQIVSRIKNKSLSEIEKQLFSPEGGSEILKLTQDSISNFCKEMKASFDYFEVNKGELVNKLYLTGGWASIEGIEKVFTEALDTEVEVLEPILKRGPKLSQAFSDKEFTKFKNSFSTLFGLIS